jgi:PAS domain S-box-containing protein
MRAMKPELENSRLFPEVLEREWELRRLIDANTIAMFTWEGEGLILDANDAFLEIIGYEREDLRSGRLRWTDLTPPEILKRELEELLPQIKLTGVLKPMEKEYFHKDGHRVPVLIGVAPYDDEFSRGMAFIVDLTEQKRAEQELRTSERERARAEQAERESKREAHLILNTIPGLASTLTPSGELEFANDELLKYCGQSLEAMKAWGTNGTAHPGDLPRAAEELMRAIASGEPYDIELRVRRFDGVYRWCQARGFPLRDTRGQIVRWYAQLYDVDDRKRAEAELRRSQHYLAEAEKRSHVASWAWSPVSNEIQYWSEECFRIHEMDPVGGAPSFESAVERVHPEDRPALLEAVNEAVRVKAAFQAEFRLLLPSGIARTIRIMGHPMLNAAGEPVEYIGMVMDVTEQKRTEHELRTSELERERAERALHDAREKLAQASKIASLAELSASIAHEINQPLQAIVANGYASLRWLDASPPNIGKAIRTAQRVVRDGNAAAEVVNRIRALFKRTAPAKIDLDINKLIVQVRTLMADEIQGNGVLLETELGADVPTITADAVQIQQVIVNLVRNAIEAMAGAQRKRLLVRSRRSATHVLLDVRDQGTGLVDPEKVFEPFVSTKETGMGMGLTICRSIIEAHGGNIWATHHEGPGATFSFSLPIDASEAT